MCVYTQNINNIVKMMKVFITNVFSGAICNLSPPFQVSSVYTYIF